MGIKGQLKGNIVIGSVFDRLTIIGGPVFRTASEGSTRVPHWECSCVCGGVVRVSHYQLLSAKTRSCGCLQVKHGETRHGTKPSPEWLAWHNMRSRCYLETNECYANYGGRGIVVCDQWREDFTVFLRDVGRKPSLRHSLDRKDVNGPYSPDNCRWATDAEQARNRRNTVLIEFDGKTLCAEDWAKITGVRGGTICKRIKNGWTVERTLTTPANRNNWIHGRQLARTA